jgi:serine/threonine-protein kinase
MSLVSYDRFGPYTVHECLGAGGMAAVHRATIDIGGGVIREVALKRLLPQLADEKKLVEDFIREAKLAAQLRHPGIVRILELGRHAGSYFIAMELVRGHSLLQLMKLQHAMRVATPIGVVVALMAELLDALDYASSATDDEGEPLHIVHRDLSPSNLIVTEDGHLKIIDFGVAKALSGKFMTQSGMVKGKLAYMALEVLAGKNYDKRVDIFSIGVVAWELITGRRLFKGANEFEIITKVRDGASDPPSTYNPLCPAELDEIVMHAISKSPDDRWPSAEVMVRALGTLRRKYKEGPRDIQAWTRTLVPESSELTETTAMQLSSRDLLPDGSLKTPKSPTPAHVEEHTTVTAKTLEPPHDGEERTEFTPDLFLSSKHDD